jgi:hypothetical protein
LKQIEDWFPKKYQEGKREEKMRRMRILLIVVGIMMTFGSFAIAAPVVDIIQAPTGFFVPTDGQKYDSPYYRWYGDDWGWTHNPIGGSITSATLNISAFDVDYVSGERDAIYAYDGAAQIFLGYLTGVNDEWSYGSVFTLGSDFFDDIATGLKIWMVIDSTDDSWAVTLAKSVLSIDGGTPPPPQPGPVPEPSTLLLLGSGLIGLGYFVRKRMKK